MIDFDEVKFLQKGDKLFDIGSGWDNACLNWTSDARNLYISGYKRAADVLVKSVVDNNANNDILIYPIAYCYRHYIEMSLKHLILDLNVLLDKQGKLSPTHDIKKLWEACKKLLLELDTEEDFDTVGNCILEFYKIDPNGESFRYSLDNKGNNSLPDDLKYINLSNLAETMEKLGNFLESSLNFVIVKLDEKKEWEAIQLEQIQEWEAIQKEFMGIDESY